MPLTLTGAAKSLDGSSLGAGTVFAQIAGVQYFGTTQSNGAYTITIPNTTGLDLTQIVAIAYAPNSSSTELVSLLGSLASIIALEPSGSTTVTDSLLPALDVTSLTTAQYGLLFQSSASSSASSTSSLARALSLPASLRAASSQARPAPRDGSTTPLLTIPVTSASALATALAAENFNEAVTVAAVIELVNSGQVMLPSGIDNTADLVADTSALSATVQDAIDNDSTALNQAANSVTQASAPTVPAASLPAHLFYVSGLAGTSSNSDLGTDLYFNQDGTGSLTESWGDPNVSNPGYVNADAFTWTLSGSTLTVTLKNGLSETQSDGGGGTLTLILQQQVYTIESLVGGTYTVSKQENFTAQDSQGGGAQAQTQTDTGTLLDPTVAGGGFSTAQLSGSTWMLPFNYGAIASEGTFESDELSFNAAGTGTALFSQQTFTWTVDGTGRLVLSSTYTDPNTQATDTVTQTEFVLGTLGPAGQSLVGVLTTISSGTEQVDEAISSPVDPGFQFTAGNVQNDWLEYGSLNDGGPAGASTIDEFVLEYTANPQVGVYYVDNCGDPNNGFDYSQPCTGTPQTYVYESPSSTTWNIVNSQLQVNDGNVLRSNTPISSSNGLYFTLESQSALETPTQAFPLPYQIVPRIWAISPVGSVVTAPASPQSASARAAVAKQASGARSKHTARS